MAASASALAVPTSSQDSACGQGSSSSSSSSSSACAFDSKTTSTFTSGFAGYGSVFANGLGGGGGPSNTNTATGGLSSSRFALGGGETGKAAAGMGSKWNGWFSLSHNEIAYRYQPLQASGRVNVALFGLDYSFANNVTLGLAGGWDESRVSTTFNGGNLKSDGYMIAPYLSWRFAPAWALDASVGWGESKIKQVDNSVAGGINGNYKSERFIGSLSLAYTKMTGKWIWTGRGAYLTGEDKAAQFTLSNNTTIASSTNRNSQIRLGGQAMYNGGTFLPYAGVYYFSDVQRTAQANVGGVTAANDRDGFQLQLGIQFAPRGQVYGGIMFTSDVGRSQVKNDMIQGNIGIRF